MKRSSKCEVMQRDQVLVTTMGLRLVSVTNGIHQLEGSTFFSKVANFSAHAVTLTPGMVIGRAAPNSDTDLLNVED
jgi:hypothetical protein